MWKQIVSFSFSKQGNGSMNLPLHQRTQTNKVRGSLKQKYDSSDDLQLELPGRNRGLFPPKSCLCLFFPPRSAPQYEGFFVVGLCVGKECDKDFKGLDKSTLSFGESPVICNIARGRGGGKGGTVVSSPQKTHPVISSAPEQLFPRRRFWRTEEETILSATKAN